MVALTPAQAEVMAELRGEPDQRPVVDPSLRKDLQAELEAELRDIEGPLTIDKYKLSEVHKCEGKYLAVDEFKWQPSNAKGTLAHKAIELATGGTTQVTPTHLVDTAIDRVCEDSGTTSLAEYLRNMTDGERAEVRVGVTDMVLKFMEMFPPFPDSWRANAEATTAAYVGNRRVVFRGKIDMKIGVNDGSRAGTVILDMKTGNPSFSDAEDLRFYALLETLRTGVPPFQWANVYLSAGRMEVEQFSEGRIRSALRRAIDGTRKIAALEDHAPVLTPGTGCTFCAARTTCPVVFTPVAV